MSAPVIGLTTYPRDERGRFHLPVEYVAAVRRAGGLPWLIPPGEERAEELFERLDGLCLSGGGDIDPALYGGARHASLYGIDRGRDESELALVREALARGLPTLGICRGCQLVNVALGGTLIEHLPDEVGETVRHRGPQRSSVPHPVELVPGSRLASIVGREAAPPLSSHHQAIREVARGLEVVARAPDGTIEAVELRAQRFFVAVQWHPEESAHEDQDQQRLFDALVRAARGD
jgi:putative glutamine amidotransferase